MTFARPSRRRQSRMAHLESLLVPCATPDQFLVPQSEEKWLEQFHRWATEGMYQQEPDFSILVNQFEQALKNAKESIDPSFYPPDDFIPHLTLSGRLCQWRSMFRFPELHKVFQSMLIMTERSIEG